MVCVKSKVSVLERARLTDTARWIVRIRILHLSLRSCVLSEPAVSQMMSWLSLRKSTLAKPQPKKKEPLHKDVKKPVFEWRVHDLDRPSSVISWGAKDLGETEEQTIVRREEHCHLMARTRSRETEEQTIAQARRAA